MLSTTDEYPRYHFSVDDVFESLIEVSDSEQPLLDHPLFAFLDELHQRYGLTTDLYVFWRQTINGHERTLRDVSLHLASELRNIPWLRFGPHGLDYDNPPYEQSMDEQRRTFDAIYEQIDRFAGPEKRSRWIRLHYFSESFELGSYWQINGVSTLLLTDQPAVSYHLQASARQQLAEHGVFEHRGIELRRSHERLEFLAARDLDDSTLHASLNAHVDRHGSLVVFSHEQDLLVPGVRDVCRRCAAHATNQIK